MPVPSQGSLSLYIFTIWKCIAYNFFCRDGIYFDKILVSEYKLFKRSNKVNLFIALVQYDVLSINNSRFAEFLPLIYPPELAVKETTDTASSASSLEEYLEFDESFQLSTTVYYRFCRDRIYFHKIFVSEYKLFKRSNKANLLIGFFKSL
jgi:hypothetical protein